MRKFVFTLAAICIYCFGFSQTNLEVISTAGDYYAPAGSNITLSWTLGEPVIETFAPSGSSVILTQGFQQPFISTLPGTYTITGYVLYDNTAATPLQSASVILVNAESQNIDTVKTDPTGYFLFNNVVNGNYTFKVISATVWGGVNPVDALDVERNYVGLLTFKDALTKTAANVTANVSGKINPVDALMIDRRFVKLITKFSIADWQFTNPTVTVSGANISQTINALCAGDVNASYVFTKSLENTLTLQNNNVVLVNPGQEFDYPITISNSVDLGAFGLVFKLPSQNLIVKDVVSNFPDLIYNIVDGQLRIAWSDLNSTGINLNQNDPVITLKLIAVNIANDNETQLSLTNESVMSDNNSNNLINELLYAPKIVFEATASGFYLGQNYPNPFRQTTMIDYSLPEAAQVSMNVYNLVGQNVGEIINSGQNAGYHQVSFVNSGLADGVYMYRINVKGANSEFTKTRMMVVSQ